MQFLDVAAAAGNIHGAGAVVQGGAFAGHPFLRERGDLEFVLESLLHVGEGGVDRLTSRGRSNAGGAFATHHVAIGQQGILTALYGGREGVAAGGVNTEAAEPARAAVVSRSVIMALLTPTMLSCPRVAESL